MGNQQGEAVLVQMAVMLVLNVAQSVDKKSG